jgi:hypothetical protein
MRKGYGIDPAGAEGLEGYLPTRSEVQFDTTFGGNAMGQPIRDEKGMVLGYFVSESEYTRLMYDLAKAESAREEAERASNGVARRYDGTNGMTTAEVLALFARAEGQGSSGP